MRERPLHDAERFARAHAPHGRGTFGGTEPDETGYSVWITCPCGASWARTVTTVEAIEELLWTEIAGIPN